MLDHADGVSTRSREVPVAVMEFEDHDRRAPLIVLARDGVRYVLLPIGVYGGAYLALDGALSYAWIVLVGWNLGVLLEGVRRLHGILTAESISKGRIQTHQLSRCVLRVKIEATAFRSIRRFVVVLMAEDAAGSFSRELDRRELPAVGRRYSAAVYLSLPPSTDSTVSHRVRVTMAMDGRDDYVYDLPVFVCGES